MINWFNAFIFVGIIVFCCEILTIWFNVWGDILSATTKFMFYTFLAWVIYMLAQKGQYSVKNPNDFLTLITFALAIFEAIQNLMVILRGAVWLKKRALKHIDEDNHKFENLNQNEIEYILKMHDLKINHLEELREKEYINSIINKEKGNKET